MSWLTWIWIVLGAASIYWFAQIGAMIAQASARLKRATAITQEVFATLQNLPDPDIPRATPTKPGDRAAILANRRRRARVKLAEAAKRQRRLVARIEKLMSEGGKSI